MLPKRRPQQSEARSQIVLKSRSTKRSARQKLPKKTRAGVQPLLQQSSTILQEALPTFRRLQVTQLFQKQITQSSTMTTEEINKPLHKRKCSHGSFRWHLQFKILAQRQIQWYYVQAVSQKQNPLRIEDSTKNKILAKRRRVRGRRCRMDTTCTNPKPS